MTARVACRYVKDIDWSPAVNAMQMHTRNLRLSARVADLRASPVREILSVIDRQGMVSFAGGLPAAETFPVLSLEGMPPGMLQYGAVEGEPA